MRPQYSPHGVPLQKNFASPMMPSET